MKRKHLGTLSMLGTFVLFAYISHVTGSFTTVLHEMYFFISGRVFEIPHGRFVLSEMLPVLFAVIVLELPFCFGAGFLVENILSKRKGGHALTSKFEDTEKKYYFFHHVSVVSLEELGARWFFLGILANIPFLSGTIAFYILFLLGNSVWALIHLTNFEDERDQHPLRTLPQFVSGFFLGYVFVKYGLFATILTHIASNSILFAKFKVQKFTLFNAYIIAYTALCAAVSFLSMTKPLTNVLPWFTENPQFLLDGWGFWDYLKISVCVTSCLVFVSALLLYDYSDAGEEGEQEVNISPLVRVVMMVGAIPLVVGLMYGAYALLGLFIPSIPQRILAIAIIYNCLWQGGRGSSTARTFWVGLPEVYISICLLQALGFWGAVALVFIETLIHTPRIVLAKLNNLASF